MENEKSKSSQDAEKVVSFKKSKFSKVLIIFAAICLLFCALAFDNGQILAGIIALIQVCLFIGSWLMGRQIIKEPKIGVRTLAAILGFILIIPYFSLYDTSALETEAIEWDNMALAERLPEPESNKGRIISNSSEELSVYIAKTSQNEYYDYVEKCKDKGFTVDANDSTSSYEAYNNEGYKLSLLYNESDKEQHIALDAPIEMSDIKWPDTVLINQLTSKPKSTVGKVDFEYDDSYAIYIGETAKDDYDSYVYECISDGFNIDYTKNEDSFWGKNAAGYYISIQYKGNNIMYLSLKSPDKDESVAAASESPAPTLTPTLAPTSAPTPAPTPVYIPEPTAVPETNSAASGAASGTQNGTSSGNQAGERIVWVGETGTKYHRQDCRTLKGKGHSITLQQALNQGREACKVCEP